MLDSYTVRKIAPRLLIAAIGINLSFYLCMAAVDITNIVGGGLGDMLRTPFHLAEVYENNKLSGSPGDFVVGIVGSGLMAVLLGVGIASIAAAPAIILLLLISLIPVALIAVAIMATLVIRYGAIIFLTVVSPIAIACLVLPGTEKYFKAWWEIFLKVLVMYPIIAAIFALSDVMAAIFLSRADSGIDGLGLVTVIVVLFVVYAPLFMIPFAFKMAGGVLAQLYDFANSKGVNGISGRLNKWKEDPNSFYGTRKSASLENRRTKGLTARQMAAGIGGGIGSLKDGRGFRRGYRADSKTLGQTLNRLAAKEKQEKLNSLSMIEGNDDIHELMSYAIANPNASREQLEQFLMKKNSGAYGGTILRDEEGNAVLGKDGQHILVDTNSKSSQDNMRDQAIALMQRAKGEMGGQVGQIVAGQQAAKATTFANAGSAGQLYEMASRIGGGKPGDEFLQTIQAIDMANTQKGINRMDTGGGSKSDLYNSMVEYLNDPSRENAEAVANAQIDSAFKKLTPQQIMGQDHNGMVRFMARGQEKMKQALAMPEGDDRNRAIQIAAANLKAIHEGITYSSAENKEDILNMYNADLADGKSTWEFINDVADGNFAGGNEYYKQAIRTWDPRETDAEGKKPGS